MTSPNPPGHDEERDMRRGGIDTTHDSGFLSGFTISPEAEAITERYVAGELDRTSG